MNFKNENDRYLALEASAGSGKTFALASRFAGLILSGEPISQILAITFTKKATSEMKERIIKIFMPPLNEKEKNDQDKLIAKIAEDFGFEPNEVRDLIEKYRDSFLDSNLKIYTFDSFFSSILRAFALNVGIDSNYEVDKNIQNLKKQIFIKNLAKKPEIFEKFIDYIIKFDKNDGNLFKYLTKLQDDNVELKFRQNHDMPSFDKIAEILNELVLMCKNGSETAKNTFAKNNIKEVLKIPALERETLNYKTFSKIYTPEFDTKFFELKDAINEYLPELDRYETSIFSEFITEYKNAGFEVNKNFKTLTFSDISLLVYKILCGENAQSSDILYFRLDDRIKHLLIDEFQDTNVVQYEILKPMIDEIVAGIGTNLGSFFYVGDKKQSIYRFRNSKKEIFDDLRDKKAQIKTTILDTNYRSMPVLVDFVNEIFKDKFVNYEPQKSAKEQEFKGKGFYKIVSVENENFYQNVVEQVKFLKENGANYENIAILCWQNKEANEVAKFLKDNEILASTQENELLSNYPAVRAILEYAKFALFNEKIYAENVKRILGVENLPNYKIDLSHNAIKTAKFIAEILKINQNDENVLYFFEILNNYQNIAEAVFADDKSEIFSQKNEGVKVITLHKSKGLEFPHVIVCDRVANRSKNDANEFLYEYDMKAGWEVFTKITNREKVDKIYENFKEKQKNFENEDRLNTLYVAFTRAEKSLIIVKKSEKSYIEEFISLPECEFGEFLKDSTKDFTPEIAPKKIVLAKIEKQEILTEPNEIYAQNGDFKEEFRVLKFGEAMHYALEMCESFEISSLQSALEATKNRYLKFLNSESFQSLKKRISALFENAEFKNLIKNGEIFKEQPLKFANSQKQIDLLVKKEDEILIFDYKSSRKNETQNVEQVRQYVEFLTKFYSQKEIRGFVLFLHENEAEILEI